MIRLLIADDHPIVREGLRRIVAECPDMRLVDEAVDGHEVIAKIDAADVDVLLLDVNMPGPGFLKTLRRVTSERPALRVLVLSVHPEDQFGVRSLRAGAAGYLTKERTPEELVEAIRQVHQGGTYITPALAESMAFHLGINVDAPPHELLSDREFEVLSLLGSGKSVAEIAAHLALSPKTVSTYKTRILEKLKLKSDAALIRYTLEHGLVD